MKPLMNLTKTEAAELFVMLVPLMKGTGAVARNARKLVEGVPELMAMTEAAMAAA
jgi:hypothetical protein